jgi:EAL domain-containing protein (putative c-di-GMP-specific phosphodiesterase class I)
MLADFNNDSFRTAPLSTRWITFICTGIDRDGAQMEEAESAMPTLAALKAVGVQLAVDDFGVAYSRFSYLRKFPLDALKATRSFINDISSNPDKTMILSALISIGKSPKHRVVAEGVETEEQLHFL